MTRLLRGLSSLYSEATEFYTPKGTSQQPRHYSQHSGAGSSYYGSRREYVLKRTRHEQGLTMTTAKVVLPHLRNHSAQLVIMAS